METSVTRTCKEMLRNVERDFPLTLISEGMTSGQLPVTVDTGTATFKADLRFRVQAGIEGSSDAIGIDIGSGAVIAIYANVLEYVTVFDFNTPDCVVEAAAQFNLNVGA